MDAITLDDNNIAELVKTLPDGIIMPLLCTGKSMEPVFLNRKTIVYLSVGIPKHISHGDVCFFVRGNGKPVLHRVVGVQNKNDLEDDEVIVFNGDAQTWTEVIKKKQIIAKVMGFRRKGESDKYVDVNDKKYLLYCNIWSKVFFLRPYIIRLYRKIIGW